MKPKSPIVRVSELLVRCAEDINHDDSPGIYLSKPQHWDYYITIHYNKTFCLELNWLLDHLIIEVKEKSILII